MGLADRIREKIDWHKAELDPRDTEREAKREEYDKKHGEACQDKPNEYGR